MARVDVIMPQMGESIFEGTITKWLKKPGDKVNVESDMMVKYVERILSERGLLAAAGS